MSVLVNYKPCEKFLTLMERAFVVPSLHSWVLAGYECCILLLYSFPKVIYVLSTLWFLIFIHDFSALDFSSHSNPLQNLFNLIQLSKLSLSSTLDQIQFWNLRSQASLPLFLSLSLFFPSQQLPHQTQSFFKSERR